MKQIFSILFVGMFAAGCASSRYDISVTAVPIAQMRADWVAVRIDRQTGQTWYSYNLGSDVTPQKPEWHPMLDREDSPKK